MRAALERVDLGHLTPSLDRTERWDRQLSLDEQQRLAFARLLLHAPRWVFLDEAIGALDDDHRRRVLSIFERELAQGNGDPPRAAIPLRTAFGRERCTSSSIPTDPACAPARSPESWSLPRRWS